MQARRNAADAFKEAERLRKQVDNARRKTEKEGDARTRMNISIEKLMSH